MAFLVDPNQNTNFFQNEQGGGYHPNSWRGIVDRYPSYARIDPTTNKYQYYVGGKMVGKDEYDSFKNNPSETGSGSGSSYSVSQSGNNVQPVRTILPKRPDYATQSFNVGSAAIRANSDEESNRIREANAALGFRGVQGALEAGVRSKGANDIASLKLRTNQQRSQQFYSDAAAQARLDEAYDARRIAAGHWEQQFAESQRRFNLNSNRATYGGGGGGRGGLSGGHSTSTGMYQRMGGTGEGRGGNFIGMSGLTQLNNYKSNNNEQQFKQRLNLYGVDVGRREGLNLNTNRGGYNSFRSSDSMMA